MKKQAMIRRFLLPIAAILGGLALIIAIYLPGMVHNTMLQATEQEAVTTVNQFKTLRGYYTKNVISKVKAFGMTPHFEHVADPNRVPLPATMIHELSDVLTKAGTSLKLYSKYPFPNRSDRRLDDFQNQAWSHLTSNPGEPFSEVIENEQGSWLRVAVADTMQAQACVDCHKLSSTVTKNRLAVESGFAVCLKSQNPWTRPCK